MKLYERFESGELTEMTEEIVEKIIADILNECDYYTHIHPEEIMDEVASEKWNGYDLECIARHYARWKMEKWTEEVCKIRAKDLVWHKDDTIDDIQYLMITKIRDIEAEKRNEWLTEFRNNTQLHEEHPESVDISGCKKEVKI